MQTLGLGGGRRVLSSALLLIAFSGSLANVCAAAEQPGSFTPGRPLDGTQTVKKLDQLPPAEQPKPATPPAAAAPTAPAATPTPAAAPTTAAATGPANTLPFSEIRLRSVFDVSVGGKDNDRKAPGAGKPAGYAAPKSDSAADLGLVVTLRPVDRPDGSFFTRPDAPESTREPIAFDAAALSSKAIGADKGAGFIDYKGAFYIAEEIGRAVLGSSAKPVGVEVRLPDVDPLYGDLRPAQARRQFPRITFDVIFADIIKTSSLKYSFKIGSGAVGPTGPLAAEELMAQQVTLLRRGEILLGERSLDWKFASEGKLDGEFETRTIAEWLATPTWLHESAFQAFAKSAQDRLHAAGVDAVLAGRDTSLGNGDGQTLLIIIGQVAKVQATESRAPENSPFDFRDRAAIRQRIVDNSPVAVGTPGDPAAGLIDQSELEAYVQRLRRRNVRDVDVAIGPGKNPGELTLDYLVNEQKPWTIYAQVQNTGTRATKEWRERVGFTNTDVTGLEDTLRIDYQTAGFDKTHGLTASYEVPFGETVFGRVFGSFNKFTAADVGFTGRLFNGEAYDIGVEARWNYLQINEWFFDVLGGIRYQEVQGSDIVLGQATATGSQFLYPYVGTTIESRSARSSTNLSATLEFQTAGVGTGPSDELSILGRLNPNRTWTVLYVSGEHSFYLEPLFAPDTFAGKNLGPGETWQPGMSLAHELSFSGRLQNAFGQRLIPNAMSAIGGLYSVRGYPESAAAGDNSYVGTAEYRFHLPQAMRPNPTPADGEPFRWVPQQTYGRADWDLIFKGFIDAGYVSANDRQPASEVNSTLVGTGVGIELQSFNMFQTGIRGSFRADWGIALKSLRDPSGGLLVKSGDNRFHFSFTILY